MEAAFFDLDKTIISRSSSLALSRPMYRAGMVTRGQLVRGAYAQLVYALVGADEKKMDRLKEGMLQLTRGWDRHEVERLVEEVLIDVIDPFVYQEAVPTVGPHQRPQVAERGSLRSLTAILARGGVRAPGGPPGLQNRCGGESSQAGSIPVRLRC